MQTDTLKKKQIKIIHVAIDRLGIKDKDYREILKERYDGKRSSKDLTNKERTDLINYFISKGFHIESRRTRNQQRKISGPKPPNLIELMTRQQWNMIRHLLEDIGFTPPGFQTFLRNRFKIGRVRRKEEASKVIQALKAMRNRAYGKVLNGG